MRRGRVLAVTLGMAALGGLVAAVTGVISPGGQVDVAAGPVGPTEVGWQVRRIVDGDTIVVVRSDQEAKVRLIGIDTPESVRPDSPVECFGPEASAFAEEMLQGRRVDLERDPTQGPIDAYGRQLAYAWYVNEAGESELFNLQAIDAGVAREYTYAGPYAWRGAFLAAEERARSGDRGLWAACR